MGDAPNGLEWGRIAGEARDEMPVHMRNLIAEQAVIHLFRVKGFEEDLREPADLFHELNALGRSQMKEFGGVAFEDDYRIEHKS